jgi:hypothetical protein
MATTIERTQVKEAGSASEAAWRTSLARLLAFASLALGAWALISSITDKATSGEIIRDVVVLAWALAAVRLSFAPGFQTIGVLIGSGAAIAAIGSLVHGTRPIPMAIAIAVGFHVLLGMPDGILRSTGRRVTAGLGYATGVVLGIVA